MATGSNKRPALLTVRSAVVLAVSMAVAVTIGLLTSIAGREWPLSVIAGIAAFAAALGVINELIE